jgi:hypothetical protein
MQEVDDVGAASDLLLEGCRAGGSDRGQAVNTHHREDVDELAVTIGVFGEPLAQARHRRRQVPVLERGAVPEGPGLSLERLDVVPGVVDHLVACEAAGMLGDHRSRAHHHEPLGIGADGRHTADVAALDTVAVPLEVNEGGRRDPAGAFGVAVKGYRHGAQCRPLLLPHLFYRAIGLFWVMPLVGDLLAALEKIGVEFRDIRKAQLRGKDPLPDVPDLVLDLALLPPGRRRAGRRLDEIVVAHREEAAVEAPLTANEHGIDCGL